MGRAKKKIVLAFVFLFLLLASSVFGYQYSASQGQKTVYADDVQCHSSICTVQSRICNNNPSQQPKLLKPSHFLDLTLKNLYVWKNTTRYLPSFVVVQENVTLYDAFNVSYEETVERTYNSFGPVTVEGWENVEKTTVRGNKLIHKPTTTLSFQSGECKEVLYQYKNTLLPMNMNVWKYDVGEDNTDILDPVVNSTDYTFNATLDVNTSLSSANIISSTNISNGVSGSSYSNDTRLISMWQLEDTSASAVINDTRGKYDLTVYNPTNLTKGIPGYINNAAASNTTNNTMGGYGCTPINDNPGDSATFSVDFWINNTYGPNLQSSIIGLPHLYVTIEGIESNQSGQILFNTRTDNCPAANTRCDQVMSITNLSSSSNLNRWVHFGYNYNGTHARLYVNNVLENTSVENFSITYGLGSIANIYLFGGIDGAGGCANGQTCSLPGGPCFSGMLDQVRWWNASITSFPINTSKYYSQVMSVNANVTRIKVTSSSTNPSLLNTSISLDGSTNRINNVTNGGVYNWTFSIKNLFSQFTHYLGIVDDYGTNVTFGNLAFSQNIGNRNISHADTLNISVNASDGLDNNLVITYTNNATFLFTINSTTGEIAANFSNISLSGTYQVRVNASANNVTVFEVFNLTLFNSAPLISSVVISPSTPGTNDPLHCTVTATDAEGDNSSGFFNWYRNGVVHSHEQNITGGWSPNDLFICEARSFDGQLNSTVYMNSSSVVTTSSSGGGGGGESMPPPVVLCPNGVCDSAENFESCPADCPLPVPPPPVVIDPLNPPIRDLEQIFKEVPPPEVCGDKFCSQSESRDSCPLDCPPFDVDVILFESGRTGKCLPKDIGIFVENFFKRIGSIVKKTVYTPTNYTCQANTTQFAFSLFLIIFVLGILLFFILGNDRKNKRSR